MKEPMADDMGDTERLIAEIFREFREGLSERTGALGDALARLERGFEEETAELFYRTAHSLKGSAPSFDANELVAPSRALAELGRRWVEDGVAAPGELVAAAEELERLREASDRYSARMEGRGSG